MFYYKITICFEVMLWYFAVGPGVISRYPWHFG